MKKLCILLAALMLLSGCQRQPAVPTETTAPTEAAPTVCASHADSDDNGLCDLCTADLLVSIDIYCVNDLHGKIADADTHPGVDELSTFLERAKRYNKNTIVLSTGDMWQGSSESNLTQGNLTTEWMNDAGFAAMVMGNHEFDWGEEPIAENAQLAQFPFLAINIYDKDTGKQVSYCSSSVMVECSGVQVGIIGAIGDCYSSIAADKTDGVYFITGDELTALVMAESDYLKSQGADFIIYAIHDGYGQSKSATATPVSGSQLRSYYDIALSDGYVDLVFEGHTHQRYLLQDEHDVYHLQNKGDNKGISQVAVVVNSVTGTSHVTAAKLLSTGIYANMEDDPIVEELLEKYSHEIEPAAEILGHNREERSSWELKQLVADLYYDLGQLAWGEEYDIVLGGGFISIRSPYSLAAGDVTYGMLQSLLPFDNRLALCAIEGRDLLSRFIHSDNDNYYIAYSDYGTQVRDNIDPNGMYYIVIDSYSYTYAPNNVTVIEEFTDGYYARDLLADFARSRGLE